MKGLNFKWAIGVSLFFVFAISSVVHKYGSKFQPSKFYVMEVGTNRVWTLDSHAYIYRDENPRQYLFPWSDPLPISIDPQAFYLGKLKLAKSDVSCKVYWKAQIACIDYPRNSDTELYLLSYVSLRKKYRETFADHPVVSEVAKGISKFDEDELDIPPVVVARAALIHEPSDSSGDWSVAELGPSIVFQGLGAVFFERAVGIELPSPIY